MSRRYMTEASLEASFHRRVRLLGGMAIKLTPTVAGVPDRLVLLPCGRMYLVELKTEVGLVREIQKDWHERAARLGTDVVILRGYQQMTDWCDARATEFDPSELSGQAHRVGPGSRAPLWTQDELDAIIAPDRPSDAELSARLGRTVPAILTKRAQITAERSLSAPFTTTELEQR